MLFYGVDFVFFEVLDVFNVFSCVLILFKINDFFMVNCLSYVSDLNFVFYLKSISELK